MATDKKMEIIIALKDQFSQGMGDMQKSFTKIVDEIRELNKAVFKSSEMVVVQLEKMNKGLDKTEKTAKKTNRTFAAVAKTFKGFGDRVSKVGRHLFSLKSAFLGLGVGLVAKSFIQAASSAENYRVRLDVLLGSQQAGAQAFKDTAEYAATVSHQFEELLQTTTALSGVMHEGTEQIKEWLPLIGDLSAVAGLSMQETTSNFIRMYSAGAAAADLFRERGILALLGIEAKTQYTVEKTRKILMDAWTDPASKFRGAALDLARTWKGLWSMMADRWFLFRKDFMESDVDIFGNLKAALALLVDKIDQMKESGELAKWAETMSKKVTDSFWSMALGVASVYDEMIPVMNNFKNMFMSMWGWFKKLPEEAKTVGVIGFMMFGSVGSKVLIATALDFYSRLDSMQKDVQAGMDPIAARDMREELKKLKESLKDMPDWSAFGVSSDFSRTTEKIKKLEDQLVKMQGVQIESVVDSEKTKKEADSTVSIISSMREKIEKKRLEMVEAGKKEARPALKRDYGPSPIELQKAELIELKANLALHNDWLNVLYDMELKDFNEYWDARKEGLEQARDAELALKEQMLVIETDPKKKLKLETALHVTRQQYAQERIALLAQEAQAEEELVAKKMELRTVLAELDAAADGGLEERHALALIQLESHHEQVLEQLRTHLDDKLAAEMGYVDKAAALKDVEAKQQKEKDKLLSKQTMEIWKSRFESIGKVTGGLKDIFNDLYEMGGKNNAKMFKIAKAAALASATVNGAAAVTKALMEGGPIMGPVMAVIIAAKTGIELAKIKNTEMGGSFAEGGEIPGNSPHPKADNIPIRATAGEFMQPVSAVKHYGVKAMEAIRRKLIPREAFTGLAMGGLVPRAAYGFAAEGGSIQGPARGLAEAVAPKIEIINVTNPEIIKGLALDAVHTNRDVVVNMVLNEMEDQNISIRRD